jgi:hypothetical protein
MLAGSRLIGNVAIAVLTAGTGEIWKSIGKSVARKALRSGLKRAFVLMVKISSSAVTKAGIEFIKAIAKDLCVQVQALSPVACQAVSFPSERLKGAVMKGVAASASSLLNSLAETVIFSRFKLPIDNILGRSFQEKLGEVILKDLTKKFTVGFFTDLMKIGTDSWVEAQRAVRDNPRMIFQTAFQDNLSKKLMSSITDYLKDRPKEWGTELVKELGL